MAGNVAKPPLAAYAHINIMGNNCIEFSDGFCYFFRTERFLRQARTVKYNPLGKLVSELPTFNTALAKVGDSLMKTVLLTGWATRGDSMSLFENLHDHGIATNRYLSWMADVSGVYQNLMLWDGKSAAEQRGITKEMQEDGHEKATAVEAVVGAVWMHCLDIAVVSEVMRRLGAYWPVDMRGGAA